MADQARMILCKITGKGHMLRKESGQMTIELFAVIPCFLVGLVLVVNCGIFLAEAARFDRISAEHARAMTSSIEDPVSIAYPSFLEMLDYPESKKGQFDAGVTVTKGGTLFVPKRIIRYKLDYTVFSLPLLGESANAKLGRRKTFTVYWSCGL
jgi:hypothetical protein